MAKSNKKGIIAMIVGASMGSLTTFAVSSQMAIYDKMFPRFDRPDYSITPNKIDYQMLKDRFPRKTIRYKSGNVHLQGYYYEAKNPKGIVVVCHGLRSGADDYIPISKFFVDNGFNVFSFDNRGTYDSEGDSTVGMCQSLVDLDNTLKYLSKTEPYKDFPLFLVGHSWGGYAVTSVLCCKTKITACASISAMHSGYQIIYEKGKQYAGKLAAPSKLFLNIYQKLLFNKYTNYDGIKGINESNIPVLVAHGIDDEVIAFDKQSIYAHKDRITNKNVEFYIGKGITGKHTSIWHSVDCLLYKEEVKSELKFLEMKKGDKLTYEEKQEFYRTIDRDLYNEINYELFFRILDMFNLALKPRIKG